MKTLFEILPSNTDAINNTIFLEIGDSLVSAIIKDEDANTFTAIAVYQLENADTNKISDVVANLLEEKKIFKLPIKNVSIISAFPQSVFVPFSLSEKEHYTEMLNMIHGDLSSSSKVHSDLINEEGIYNVYKFPDTLWQVLTTKFGSYKLNHLYTSLLKTISRENDIMQLIFYPGKVIVLIIRDGKYLLINTFDYLAPEDVSYLLLNLCKQFNLKNVPLELSGFIEENSILYKEIYKYFSVVNFDTLPTGCSYHAEVENYPSHYFSHHFGTGLCE